ncbi:zf-CCHC domain-containing protein [Cucumis melo var. makuwa]|uniref:Zf-CCHC domain-containing protein n=1 Tax=Cucumis melo var. makuwa TaxID=1194695 RepID=A0A5D3BNX1_CUCMM|nr:zf-CCHC domain-containing protein [Cucumis melo var. makuwa]
MFGAILDELVKTLVFISSGCNVILNLIVKKFMGMEGQKLSMGTVCTQVIFPLSTLSVLRDNDAVAEIELPVPDTLSTSAESSGSNSRSAGIVRGDDVCWLHAIFRAKIVGGPGGGVTTWSHATTYQQTTQAESGWDAGSYPGQSERGSSTPRDQNEAGSERFARSAQEIGRQEKAWPSDPEKMCCRFERGLRFEIRTLVTVIAKWMDFSQLVETALRVEQSIVEEKSAMELSRGVSTTSGIRGREQRRFTPGVSVSGCQDFKRRSGGKPLRQMSSGSAYQRQSQRASSQFTNSVARSRTGQESVASESRRTPCVSCCNSHQGQCLIGVGVCYQCGKTRHFKRDCPQLRVAVRRDQGVESLTVEQPRISTAAGEGTSGARQKGVVGRHRQ